MRRKHRSAAEWQKILIAFGASDLKPVAFCQANQIGIKSFYRARLKYGSGSVPGPGNSSSGFVTLIPERPLLTAPSGIEVILPHARLRLDAGVSPAWVADLLKSLAT